MILLKSGFKTIVRSLHSTPGNTNVIEREILSYEEADFTCKFDKYWEVKYKWRNTPSLPLNFRETKVPDEHKQKFNEEIENWIKEDILIKYDCNIHGKIKHFLPMLAVKQEKCDSVKIRPVMDFRLLNKCIETHTNNAVPVCADRLRKWRQQGPDAALLDLKKAYLQVRVCSSLWCYQAVRWKNETYLLTRLGFGLASAPAIMTYIVEKVINFNDDFSGRVSSYIDDIFVPTNLISAQDVKNHFEEYGLMCKEPQHLSHNSVRVLGLKVEGDWSWSRDKPLPDIQNGKLTRREAHGIVGEWIGHFPVAGWLRIVAAFVQRLTAEAGTKWDDAVDNSVKAILVECHNRLTQKGDPVCGYGLCIQERPCMSGLMPALLEWAWFWNQMEESSKMPLG